MQQLLEFAGNHPFLIAAALGLIATIVVTEVRLRNRGFQEISPADAIRLINNEGAVVLDVRARDDYVKGHIIDAQHAPAEELPRLADGKLKKLRDKPVIISCDRGLNSMKAADTLRKHDFARVFSLRGGLEAWRRDNYPLER